MHQRAGTRPSGISPLQLLALVTIAGAILLHTALLASSPTHLDPTDPQLSQLKNTRFA
jgi:hypothetical protein